MCVYQPLGLILWNLGRRLLCVVMGRIPLSMRLSMFVSIETIELFSLVHRDFHSPLSPLGNGKRAKRARKRESKLCP